MRHVSRIAAILATLLLTYSLGAQQQFPTLERGLVPGKLYQVGGIDNVNIFNGNLNISIPIGETFPVDGGLGYRLTLSYNSNLWDWEHSTNVNFQPIKIATPALRSNAGDGWILGYGEFIAAGDPSTLSFYNAYGAPDGSERRFDRWSTGEPDVQYTTDGSNLRLRLYPPQPIASVAYIDFPDGTSQLYSKNSQGHWDLTEIDAPRGSGKVTISRPSVRPAQCGNQTSSWWQIQDGTRTQYVCFATQNVDFVNKPMVDSIVLTGPQGQTSTYRFQYFTFDVQLPLGEPYPQPGEPGRRSHRVTVLTAIILPDLTSYTFEHWPNRTGAVNGLYSDPSLLSVTLPTGGRIEYDYGFQYAVPPMALCVFGVPADPSGAVNFGVPPSVIIGRTLRKVAPPGGAAEAATWSYGWVRHGDQTQPYPQCADADGVPSYVYGPLADEVIAQVTDPDGNRTDTHFSVWPGDMIGNSSNGFAPEHYGFPYGPVDASQNRYLSTERLACAQGQCTPLRTTYVRHDTEARTNVDPNLPYVANPIHRPASERTFYRDDPVNCTIGGTSPCPSVTNESTGWDGFAHYRTVTTTHDFPGLDGVLASADARTRMATTDFLMGGLPASGAPWTPDEYGNTAITDNGVTVATQACFDTDSTNSSKRFLRATRRQQGMGPGAADVISLFALTSAGNVGSEQYFGGDQAPLAGGAATAGDLCSAISLLSASPAYEIDHTWQYGVMASSQYSGASFLSSDLTIDSSGLVSQSRDSAGALTKYFYDPSSRIIRIEPQGVDALTYTYAPAQLDGSGNLLQPASVVQKRDSSTDPMETDYFFDSFGRVWRQADQMPAGKWRLQETITDVRGRQKSVSEYGDLPALSAALTASLPNITAFDNYDLFDRAGLVTSPDGSTVSFGYRGDRVKTKTGSVATSLTGQSSVLTTEGYDGFGRLTAVVEPSGASSAQAPAGPNITTLYTYDPASHLATVKMTDESGVHQDRAFQYDGRGFLSKETHPENGDTTYDVYDARGHAITRSNGGTTLTFGYDTAERLLTVTDQTGKTVKQFGYGTANSGNDLRNGKMTSAVRRNDLSSAGRIDVTESYEYGETAGMMSRRTTSVESVSADGGTRTPIQQFAYSLSNYDHLLNPSTITMPTCSIGDCSAPTTQQGIQTTAASRSAGYLTSVAGCVANCASSNPTTLPFGSFAYHPSGMMATVTHATANAATDQYDASNDMPRPSKITFMGSNGPTAFVSGSATIGFGGSATLRVDLTGTPPWTLHWSDNVVQPSIMGTPFFRSVSPPSTTTYTVTSVTDASSSPNGSAGGSATVTVTSCPATINAAPSVCASSLNNSASTSATGAASWSWSLSAGTITGGQGTSAITYTAPASGPFTISVALGGYCASSASANVNVTPGPTAFVSGSTNIAQGAPAVLHAALTGTPPWHVVWSDGVPESGITNPAWTRTVTPAVTTTYTISQLTDSSSCPTGAASGAALITVGCQTPQVTTPATVCVGSTNNYATVNAPGATLFNWAVSSGGQITGGQYTSQITYQPPPVGPFTITVTLADYCIPTASAEVNTAYGPSATVSGSTSIAPGGSATVRVDLAGAPPWHLQWSDGLDQPNVTSNPSFRTVTPPFTTTYTITSITDQSSCWSYGVANGAAVITVNSPGPTSISAVSQADLNIGPSAFRFVAVSWPAVSGAVSYIVERATSISNGFGAVAQTSTTSWTDAPAYSSTPQTYLYRVWSVSTGGVRSQTPSPMTFATVASPLFTDEPISQFTTGIRGIHIGELRRAIDEVRRAAGLTPNWTSYAAATGAVSLADSLGLRTALNAACVAIRGTACSYAGAVPAANGPVLAVHIQSVRDAVK